METRRASIRPLVLVVEDNQDALSLYEIVLSEAGYEVVSASDGRAGLDLARRVRPAVIVLDMMMPDMDGLEFLERLPSCGQPVPPVIVSSGFPDFEQHARARGARAFLRKPVTADELLAAVERGLAGHREASVDRAQAARVEAARERAREERARILDQVDLEDPELSALLEGVLAWLSRYHGFGTGLVDLLCGDKIFVAAGTPTRIFIERSLAYCSDVVDAGSSLLIPDVSVHPVFAGHEAAAYWGTRFYAGCPVVTPGGCVLGTVCLIDREPRRFAVGDMRILEYLARRIGEHFGALAEGSRPAPFFEPPALFERAAIAVVLEAQAATATGACLLLVTLAGAGADPALHRRAVEALMEAGLSRRVAASRWTDETLAFVCDGAHDPGAIERALGGLHGRGLEPLAASVAQHRSTASGGPSAGTVIAAAEAARARSAALGGTVVHADVEPARPLAGPRR